MTENADLLRRYALDRSDTAFAALVQRHIDFVYASALRRLAGDTHLAEDVTQQVFTALARRAPDLVDCGTLIGWLFTTTRHLAAQVVRGERRRRAREATATLMDQLTSRPAHDADWERLRPVLDDAMDAIGNDDRQAVLLRFFEGKSYADIGAALRLAENTARMRVDRALEKLRATLERRGVTSTTAGLALALANQPGIAAPASLAATVTSTALTTTATTAGGSLLAALGFGKLQLAATAAVALAGGAAYYTQAETNAALLHEIAALEEQRQSVPTLRAKNQQLAAAVREVELLRRDDLEFQQLASRVADVKRANDERTRLARVQSAKDRYQQLQEWIRDQDRLAQTEVDRLNREGNALVGHYKRLKAEARDPALPTDARAHAEAAATAKLAEIQAKQREIKDYTAESRRVLGEHQAELRQLAAVAGQPTAPGAFAASERLELNRRAAEIEQRRANRPDSSAPAPSNPRGTLFLKQP